MNKALKALILSLTTYCLCGGMSANAAIVRQFSATDAGKLQKPDTMVVMKDVTVVGNRQHDFQMRTSVNNINIDRSYLHDNFAGSLMQTLSGIPGVKAMNVGSGQSKPAIRGLGFNRMVVALDGIKHEGQQWGDEHGLEIDQFSIDRIDIVKGPAALLYGSDAIGGVINLYNNYIPTKPFQGSVSIFSRSNNESIGASARLEGKAGNFFWRTNFTLIDYADFKVPTDSIQYYSYYIHLKNRRLRNTAGKERDGSITLGYKSYNFRTDLKISNSNIKSGFFANAHGIEVLLSQIDYDKSRRDIDLPYQEVNHLTLMNHTTYQLKGVMLEANLAYQDNKRREFSEPQSHGYMPMPQGTLEREFNKSTYTANLGMKAQLGEKHELNSGVNVEHQHNRRAGWGFVIPDFGTLSLGVYTFDRYTITKNLIVNAGVRYDFVRTRIDSYFDWYKTPVGVADSIYKERSSNIRRTFNCATWSAGVNYTNGKWLLKANIGKSFRVPIAKELGADGVNYNIFRYEKGNPELKPEESYQMDAGINWDNGVLSFQLDPYVNYFPNYIYMNPTSGYYEGLQLYHYTQSKVLRWGFEATVNWKILDNLEADLKGEYLYARQLSGEKKGYTLPFSTPFSIDASLKYSFCQNKPDNEGYVSLSGHIVGAQNDIVPPEKPTPGYFTLNMTAGKEFKFDKCTLKIGINAENLLNRKYYDHTSYYRLIDVPEPGRNVAVMVGLDF